MQRDRTEPRLWFTDVKFARTDEGWLYLAPVLDLFSRRVIGLAMSASNDGGLARAAIERSDRRMDQRVYNSQLRCPTIGNISPIRFKLSWPMRQSTT